MDLSRTDGLQVWDARQLGGFEGIAVLVEGSLGAHQMLELLEGRPDLFALQQLSSLDKSVDR